MSDAVQPCPHCAGTDIRIQTPTCHRDTPYNPADRAFPVAVCQGCYASAPGDSWDHTGISALVAWNRRAPQPPQPAADAATGVAGLSAELREICSWLQSLDHLPQAEYCAEAADELDRLQQQVAFWRGKDHDATAQVIAGHAREARLREALTLIKAAAVYEEGEGAEGMSYCLDACQDLATNALTENQAAIGSDLATEGTDLSSEPSAAAGRDVRHESPAPEPMGVLMPQGEIGINPSQTNNLREKQGSEEISAKAGHVGNKLAPDGWKLVPREPTEVMLDRGVIASEQQRVSVIYRAMWDAAPQPSGDQ